MWRCEPDEKCNKYWCGEYTGTLEDVKWKKIDMKVNCGFWAATMNGPLGTVVMILVGLC